VSARLSFDVSSLNNSSTRCSGCNGSVGGISEIFDGDAPHAPRGCIAQAWSVAEVLRAWMVITGSPDSRW